jgi:hypothetical protein
LDQSTTPRKRIDVGNVGYDCLNSSRGVIFAGSYRGGSAIDGRTAHYQGYGQSINARKRIEQVFGWIKQAAGLRQLKARGRSKVGAVFQLNVVAYNLIRITNLLSTQEVMA